MARASNVAASTKWKRNNPKSNRLHMLNAHAKSRGWPSGAVGASDLEARLEEFVGGCAYCVSPATEWDHIVPLSQGGDHTINNLVPSCRRCNASKGQSKLIFGWTTAPT